MKIPSFKEDRLQLIIKSLECMDENKFNRDKMRKCILGLYPNKSEKAVFRGIAIPTSRHLGLIVGYDEYIRPSADGILLLKSRYDNKLHQDVTRAIFLEIDKNLFGFIDTLKKLNFEMVPYLHFEKNVEGAEEYKKRWLKVLDQCELIKLTEEKKWAYRKIFLMKIILSLTERNLDYRRKRIFFKEYLFRAYEKLSLKSAGIVDMEDLRGEVALKLLKEKEEIITERQFDDLLREIPLAMDKYIISLGQPMGAEEKLFELNGKYYRTLSIKMFMNTEGGNDR